jgi:glycine/D-amino acid oxidase-like deaminating enzyme
VRGVRLAGGGRLPAGFFINTAGPLLGAVGRLLGVELPVRNELHLKLALRDSLGVVPRHAPLLIWNDPQTLAWTAEERQALAEDPETTCLLGELPPGAHLRPEGSGASPIALLLWEYRERYLEPAWPLPLDPLFTETVLRGAAAVLPALQRYLGRLSRPVLDGGYYTQTPANQPLIGPLPVEGAFVLGALSGFGVMAACAAAELLAAHLTGSPLPGYAGAFHPAHARAAQPEDPAFGQL